MRQHTLGKSSGSPLLKTLGRGAVPELTHRYPQIGMHRTSLDQMMSERSHHNNPAARPCSRLMCAKRNAPSLTHRPDPPANPMIYLFSMPRQRWVLNRGKQMKRGTVRLCLPFPCVSTPLYGPSCFLSLVHSSPSVFDLLLT